MTARGFSFLLLLPLAVSACRSEHTFQARGRIAGFGDNDRTLIIEHEEIPGLMPAMTMPFTAADSVSTSGLALRDPVAFQLVIDASRSRIHSIQILPDSALPEHPAGVPAPHRAAAADEAGAPSIARPGTPVPEIELLTHADTTLHLEELRGRFVLLTFIYTRCPLPDFCVLMSRNFAELQPEIRKRLGERAHLLSISLDPDHDTPGVLREYAARYTDRLDTWTFATGDSARIRQFAERLGVFYTPAEGEIVHNLVTALIGPHGTILQYWRGNDWAPGEVAAEMARLDRQRARES